MGPDREILNCLTLYRPPTPAKSTLGRFLPNLHVYEPAIPTNLYNKDGSFAVDYIRPSSRALHTLDRPQRPHRHRNTSKIRDAVELREFFGEELSMLWQNALSGWYKVCPNQSMGALCSAILIDNFLAELFD
jgi:hypothetical protein